MRRGVSLIILLFVSFSLFAGGRIAVGFYDVGRLYDTIPSNFYNDKSYTPSGRNRWDSTRYNRKIESVVAVIDSMQMPIIALDGVENEEVVRDIVSRSSQDYSYVHRTIDYYNGLDFALLYYGDRLFIDYVEQEGNTLIVRGEIDGATVVFYLVRVASKLRTLEPVYDYERPDITIAWGGLSRDDLRRLRVGDPLRQSERAGHGDTKGEFSWYFDNRVGCDLPKASDVECGVYITEWLLTADRSAPLATIANDRYWGGYSNHLPLYLYINIVPNGGN